MDNVELVTTMSQVAKQRPGSSEMVEATEEGGKETRVPISPPSTQSFVLVIVLTLVRRKMVEKRNESIASQAEPPTPSIKSTPVLLHNPDWDSF